MNPEDLYPVAPDIAAGIARRRIRLTGSPGRVVGELEDHAHGMRCTIEHDGSVITAVNADFRRIPMSTCLGAGDPLAELVGVAVGSGFADFFRDGRARRNCTHMFDIAWLATAHAARGDVVRQYDVEMPDEDADGRTTTRLLRDGELVLEWELLNAVIQAPAELAGRELFRGFTSWAVDRYEGDALEAVLVLQKARFVSRSRRFLMRPGPLAQIEKDALTGVCHGYGAARVDQAVRLPDTHRDFTDHPERLLQFL